MRKGLMVEASVVGASFAAIGGALQYAAERGGLFEPPPTMLKRVPQIGVLFLTGVVGHLIWEGVGGNRWFSANYPATLPESERQPFLALQGRKTTDMRY